MESAFGVDHGWIYKARDYKRDATGKFSHTVGAGQQAATKAFQHQTRLIQAEKDPATWQKRRKAAEQLADDMDRQGHGQLADDLWMVIHESEKYQKHFAQGKVKSGSRLIHHRDYSHPIYDKVGKQPWGQ